MPSPPIPFPPQPLPVHLARPSCGRTLGVYITPDWANRWRWACMACPADNAADSPQELGEQITDHQANCPG